MFLVDFQLQTLLKTFTICIHNKSRELLLQNNPQCKHIHLSSTQSVSKHPQSSHSVSDIPHNKQKNRFANIFPCMLIILYKGP